MDLSPASCSGSVHSGLAVLGDFDKQEDPHGKPASRCHRDYCWSQRAGTLRGGRGRSCVWAGRSHPPAVQLAGEESGHSLIPVLTGRTSDI